MTKVVFAAPAVIAGLAAVLAIGPGGRARRGAARRAVSKGSASQATPALGIIDGRLDPQDIPNSTAYRLWLLAASEPRTGAVAPTARTEAMLMDAGLRGGDVTAAIAILARFEEKYQALVAAYNRSPEVFNRSSSGLADFLARRDALVAATRAALIAGLSAPGQSRLDSFVKDQKRNMRIARPVK
jgi:hypothetical protein